MIARTVRSAELTDDELAEVHALLVRAFDGDFADTDWEHTLGGWHVLVSVEGSLVAHAAAVERELEADGQMWRTGYVEGVATEPARQGEGYGSIAMRELEVLIRQDHQFAALSTERPAFYERLGWQRWQGPTFVRSDGPTTRTTDEDDGIMVLRFGPSSDVDLATPIICESRPGDDW